MGLLSLVRRQRASDVAERDVSRRRFLTRGAITAAVAAAGAAALAEPASATGVTTGAADGDALQIGGANTNTANSANATRLTGTTNGGAMFSVQQNAATGGGIPIAIAGAVSGISAVAIYGTASASGNHGGIGVQGASDATDGVGVLADASAGAALVLKDRGQTIPPVSGNWTVGSFVVTGGQLWFCYAVVTGVSQWVKLSSTLVTLPSPVRVYDSRPGANPLGIGPKTPLAVNEDRLLDMTVNSSGVPATASTVLLNVAVTATGPTGFLGVFKDGISYPNNASLNWGFAGQNTSNAVTSAITNGKLRIHCGGSATDVIVDVVGYYL